MSPRRTVAEVNAGSMADIAFLLLIFFLVTTTIATDKGLLVRLPPFTPDQLPEQMNTKNICKIALNANDQLLVRNEEVAITDLRERVKVFIMNPGGLPHLPAAPNQAILSLVNDRATSYAAYLAVYNELKAAYQELWNEAAQTRYGTWFDQLTPAQQQAIRARIPLVISEAEPTDHETP